MDADSATDKNIFYTHIILTLIPNILAGLQARLVMCVYIKSYLNGRQEILNKQNILTIEGLAKLEEELDFLKSKRRAEVALRIKQALAFGDISENSEYDEAKNEQAFVEGRIAQIENILKTAKVIDDEDIQTDTVSVGCKVTLKDIELGDEVEYTIVGSAEADPMNLKISNESPVGNALMGKSVNSIVDIVVPDGIIKYEILNIKK